jgi:hypothetical protein
MRRAQHVFHPLDEGESGGRQGRVKIDKAARDGVAWGAAGQLA